MLLSGASAKGSPSDTQEASVSKDQSYYLGTHDDELQRLGLQHRVWQPDIMAAWHKAGVTLGQTVVDAGSGPGFASFDLAELVGPEGRVVALERSQRFVDHTKNKAKDRGLSNIEAHRLDLVEDELPVIQADVIWVRWFFAFLEDPVAVLEKLAALLKPGGVMIVCEYIDWATMSWIPEQKILNDFRETTLKDWRATGSEPDVATRLIPAFASVGLRLVDVTPVLKICRPSDFTWQWPMTFTRPHARALAERGVVSHAWAEEVATAYDKLTNTEDAMITTPLVGIMTARKG